VKLKTKTEKGNRKKGGKSVILDALLKKREVGLKLLLGYTGMEGTVGNFPTTGGAGTDRGYKRV